MYDEKNELKKLDTHDRILEVISRYISYAAKNKIQYTYNGNSLDKMFFLLSDAEHNVIRNKYNEDSINKLLTNAMAELSKAEVLYAGRL